MAAGLRRGMRSTGSKAPEAKGGEVGYIVRPDGSCPSLPGHGGAQHPQGGRPLLCLWLAAEPDGRMAVEGTVPSRWQTLVCQPFILHGFFPSSTDKAEAQGLVPQGSPSKPQIDTEVVP